MDSWKMRNARKFSKTSPIGHGLSKMLQRCTEMTEIPSKN